ncbi:hypothetical protein BDV98DRAFT_215537 [Pterulicium gracile]|uniref:Uncharacterized protein n=1 Tax=Pterulicium gracile TaxID=1884261 RepID=A0A5C3Q8B7_9AGAR|nr:hypothetical protein BDV98DRAFT_215537 [Pterula gracilis]
MPVSKKVAQGVCKTHQDIVLLLSDLGLINAPVLILFRASEIRELDLSETNDLAEIFTPILAIDLAHLTRLPALSSLHLDDTNIGNEAIFILVALSRTLTSLSIASNPLITDACVPALMTFTRLFYLSLEGTGIRMAGLRMLAKWIVDSGEEGERGMDIRIPEECEAYLDHMDTQYLVDIPHTIHDSQLVSSPSRVSDLATPVLLYNLEAHADWNPSIRSGGSRAEMKERLRGVLEVRRSDLVLAGLITVGDEEGDELKG